MSTPAEEEEPVLRPEMPDYGVYFTWPEEGTDWIHPEDVDLVKEYIPGERIFRREKYDGEYYHLSYGNVRFRVKPSLWRSVPTDGIDVLDRVEVKSLHGVNEPFVGVVEEMIYHRRSESIEYVLRQVDYTLDKRFRADDLILLDEKPNLRVGFYEHEIPKQISSDKIESLDVGDLL